MSFFILNQLRCCRSRVNWNKRYRVCGQQQQVRNFSGDSNDCDDEIITAVRHRGSGQAAILVQQGTEIQELPVIVRRCSQNDITMFCSNKRSLYDAKSVEFKNDHFTANKTDPSTAHISTSNDPTVFITSNPVSDCGIIIKLLERCETGENILKMIASLPETELEQDTLVFALEAILRIEPMEKLKLFEANSDQYQYLLDNFCRTCDTTILLNLLKELQSMLFMNLSIERICDEILLRNSDGCLNIMEICESIHRFVECHQYSGAEKFWSGLSDASNDINENNIKFVFEVLPKLKVSRKMVICILDRRIVEVFPLLKPDAVNDIMEVMKLCNIAGNINIFKSITRWININIHALNEAHLKQFVHCLSTLNYTDSDLENAIERFMKAKATKIKSQTLVVEFLRHLSQFRLLNPHILNGCSEFFVNELNNIDPENLRDFVFPFGQLHFQPSNAIEFWKNFENILDLHFYKLSASHIIDILLSTVYLKLLPVNFIDRVFNRIFMHGMNSTASMSELPILQEKLRILDTAFSIEFNGYYGPLLPRQKDCNKVVIDKRIVNIIDNCSDMITMIAGDKMSYSTSTVPRHLPFCNLYAIDILFHPPGFNRLNYNKIKDRNVLVAALIHLPEHYDSSGEHLIGEQQMRIRHMQEIGIKVVSLEFTMLSKLSMHRKELYEYFTEQMTKAKPAIKPNNE